MSTLSRRVRQSSVLAFIFVLVLTAHFAQPTALAQTTAASVSGRVTDSSNAAVVGAEVEIRNTDTGSSQTTQTNGAGIYRFPVLQSGNYLMNVHKESFRTVSVTGITLNVQDNVSRNFVLQVGSITESITVTSDSVNVNTTDASVSTLVDQSYVKNMPLNGRSFQDLILLTPGVVTQAPMLGDETGATAGGNGQTGEFSVNGQRTESNNYTVDGVSANVGASASTTGMFSGAGLSGSVAAATALGTTQALVPVDDLQEFRVESSSYSAEFGRNPGGQFIFETKSGTSQWHGTGFEYLRNGYLDATDWFTGFDSLKQAPLRQNDFGGTFGGPIRKDKTFFFLSYEGLRLLTPQPAATEQVPDNALRAATPAPLQQVLNAYPLQSPNAQDPPAPNGFSYFFGSWSNPSAIDSGSVRLDHVISGRHRLFFRFSDTSSNSLALGVASLRSVPPSQSHLSDYTTRTYTAGATSLLTDRLSNDFRLNYTSNRAFDDFFLSAFGGSTPVDLQKMTPYGPNSFINMFFSVPPFQTQLWQGPQSETQRQWNFVDTLSVSWGRHQFKFGGDYRRLTPIAIQFNPAVLYYFNQAYPTQNSNASIATNEAIEVAPTTQGPAYPLYVNFSAFGQDEWRIAPRLTLSMGLRWEVNPAPGVTQGLKPFTIVPAAFNVNTSLAPEGTPLWKTTWFNFAPRLGAAYVLRDVAGWETVLRGGGGVFFDTGQQVGSAGFQGPGFLATNFAFNSPFPGNVPAVPIPSTPSINDCLCGYGFPPHLQLPYTLQWNASLEQSLGKSQALTVSYVGSRASRLLQSNFGYDSNGDTIGLTQNRHSSDYNSLQTQFQRRLSRGLTALGSYTWSHCIDYGSSNILVDSLRGNCNIDVRHNFTGAFSYDLPKAGHGVVGAILSNWGIDDRFMARTGFPVVLNGSFSVDPNTQKGFFGGLDLVPGQPIYVTQCTSPFNTGPSMIPCPGGKGINPKAFVAVQAPPGSFFPTRNGTAPRNFVRGFGAWQMNFAVRREFPIYEQLKLQFRAEAFNLFNHPNFGNIQNDIGNPTFGEATQTLATTLGSNSALISQYQMGGPRSMQFALKLVF